MPKILICDDDEDIRELLGLHLSNAGYDVMVAEDAMVAGRIILKTPPDLIITDVHMPFMSGFELISAMSKDKTIPRIPFVILTADEMGDTEAKELGAAGFVMKPVRADALLAVVRSIFPKE